MAQRAGGKIESNATRCAERFEEAADMLGKGALIEPSESEVEKVAFAEAPAVARQIGTEVKLGNLRLDRARRGFAGVHLEFDFLGNHGDIRVVFLRHALRPVPELP